MKPLVTSACLVMMTTAVATAFQIECQYLDWSCMHPFRPSRFHLLGSALLFIASAFPWRNPLDEGSLGAIGCLVLWTFYIPFLSDLVGDLARPPHDNGPGALMPPFFLLSCSILCPIVIWKCLNEGLFRSPHR